MRFIDKYFYNPNIYQKIIIVVLIPVSLLYLILSIIRRKKQRFIDFNIPIISIGNLIAGGSGKTPFIKEVASYYKDVFIISRGYKRKSKGMLIVSINGILQVNQIQSGDEAYLLASSLKNASVIVSKNRKEAILKAKTMGAKCIFLDDGFRFNFKKLNIVMVPKLEPYFKLTLPSGLYRENPFAIKNADLVLKEDVDYKRIVNVINKTERMILVTAIANPSRIDEFLPKEVIGKIILNDHSRFDLNKIEDVFVKLNASSLLVTQKDAVKLESCKLPLSVLNLTLDIKQEVIDNINNYIDSYNAN